MVAIFYSERFLDHDTGPYHTENPGRLQAIVQALKASPWAQRWQWHSPTPIDIRNPLPLIESVHAPKYVQRVAELARSGGGALDPDTQVSPASYEVACLAVNAWLDGVDQVLGHHRPAFVLARPPGHHAMPNYGMGFCLFANGAIAAHYALQQPQVNRVAILDWDVHHGNGTQAIVENHPQISYCSLHQAPFYPGTGLAQERGAHGNILNLPIAAGSNLLDYQRQFEHQVIPFLTAAQPDLLIVSAGYDANKADPLAQVQLQPQDYGIFTQQCLALTPRILFGLEGGYDYDSLAQSVLATLEPCLA
jgi:acetoin utilization deacetylase AcuC-like enzyme